ncbi:hypothetical protein Emag_002858 [Eimeria magna]
MSHTRSSENIQVDKKPLTTESSPPLLRKPQLREKSFIGEGNLALENDEGSHLTRPTDVYQHPEKGAAGAAAGTAAANAADAFLGQLGMNIKLPFSSVLRELRVEPAVLQQQQPTHSRGDETPEMTGLSSFPPLFSQVTLPSSGLPLRVPPSCRSAAATSAAAAAEAMSANIAAPRSSPPSAAAAGPASQTGLVDLCLPASPLSQGPPALGDSAGQQGATSEASPWTASPAPRALAEGGAPPAGKPHRRSSFASSLLGWGRSSGAPSLDGPTEANVWPDDGAPQGQGAPWGGPHCDSLDSEEAGALPAHWRATNAAAEAPASSASVATPDMSKLTSLDPQTSPSRSSRTQQLQQQLQLQQQQKQQQQQQLSESVLQAIAIRKLQLLPLREWEDEQRARRNEFFRAIGEVIEAVGVAFRQGERDHHQILKFFRARGKVDRETARALRHCSSSLCPVQQQQQHSSSSRRASGAAAPAAGVADQPATAASSLQEGPLGGGGPRRSPSSSRSGCSLSPPYADEEGPLPEQAEAPSRWKHLRGHAAEGSSSSSRADTRERGRDTETPPWLSKAFEQITSDQHEGHSPAVTGGVAATAATAPVPHAAAAPVTGSAQQVLEGRGFSLLGGRTGVARRSNSSNSGDLGPQSTSSDSAAMATTATAVAAAESSGSSSGTSAALQEQLFGGARRGMSCASWVGSLVEWTRQQSLLQDALSTFSDRDLVKAHIEGLVLHYEREGTKELVKLRQLEAAARRADAASLEAWAAYVQLLDSSSEPSTFERQHLHKKKPPSFVAGKGSTVVAAANWLQNGSAQKAEYVFRAFVLKTYSHCTAAILSLSLPGLSSGDKESAADLAARQCTAALEQLQLSTAAAASPPQQQTSGTAASEQQPTEHRRAGPFSALSDGHGSPGGMSGPMRDDSRGLQESDACAPVGDNAKVRRLFNDSRDLYPLWLILSEEGLLPEGAPGLVPHPFRCRLLAAAAETLQGASPPPSSRLLLRRGPAQLQIGGLSSLLSRWETGFVCLTKSRLLHFFSQANAETPIRTFFVGSAEVKRIGSREVGKLDIQVTVSAKGIKVSFAALLRGTLNLLYFLLAQEKKRRGLLPRSSVVFRVNGTRDCNEWLSAIELAADDKAFLASAQDIRANVEVPLDAYDSPSFSFTPFDGDSVDPMEAGAASGRVSDRYGLSHMQPFSATAGTHQPDDAAGGLPSSSMDEVSLDGHPE